MASPAPLTPRTRALALALAALGVLVYAAWLPRESVDMQFYLLPWFDAIRTRGLAAMSGEFSNYAPPYLYLLGLAAASPFALSPVVLIKSVSVAFTVLAAIVFAQLVRDITGRRALALVAGCAFPLVPTVAVNAAWWGQCDIVYTFFLLGALAASLRRRPLAVAVHFALALSFKAQAVFLAPYLLVLVWRRELPWRYALVVPLVFAAMMLPAWLAGRPAAELALVYANQGTVFRSLSMNAPNPWAFVQRFALVPYAWGVVLGCAGAALASLALAWRAAERPDADAARTRVALAAASVLLVPWLLPKMHDRYFFAADVLLVLLACIDRRYRLAALAMQAGSLVVYAGYLASDGQPRALYSEVGCVLATVALVDVLRRLAQGRGGRAAAAPSRVGAVPPGQRT